MGFVGVANWESKFKGVGCDGANVNSCLKGQLTDNAMGGSIVVLARAGIERCSKAYFLCTSG